MTTKTKRIVGISAISVGVVGLLYFGSKISPSATIEASQKLLALVVTSSLVLGSGVTIFVTQ